MELLVIGILGVAAIMGLAIILVQREERKR
jgi:hypothetical protein